MELRLGYATKEYPSLTWYGLDVDMTFRSRYLYLLALMQKRGRVTLRKECTTRGPRELDSKRVVCTFRRR